MAKRLRQTKKIASASQRREGRGTHSGAVVDFLPHIVADVLQLQLCHLIHRPHYMRDCLGTVEGAATGLWIDKSRSGCEYGLQNVKMCRLSGFNLPDHRLPRSSGFCEPGWTCPQSLPLEVGLGVRPPMCGTVCGVGTNALGSSYELPGFPWTAGVPVEAGEIQIVPVNTDKAACQWWD